MEYENIKNQLAEMEDDFLNHGTPKYLMITDIEGSKTTRLIFKRYSHAGKCLVFFTPERFTEEIEITLFEIYSREEVGRFSLVYEGFADAILDKTIELNDVAAIKLDGDLL